MSLESLGCNRQRERERENKWPIGSAFQEPPDPRSLEHSAFCFCSSVLVGEATRWSGIPLQGGSRCGLGGGTIVHARKANLFCDCNRVRSGWLARTAIETYHELPADQVGGSVPASEYVSLQGCRDFDYGKLSS